MSEDRPIVSFGALRFEVDHYVEDTDVLHLSLVGAKDRGLGFESPASNAFLYLDRTGSVVGLTVYDAAADLATYGVVTITLYDGSMLCSGPDLQAIVRPPGVLRG